MAPGCRRRAPSGTKPKVRLVFCEANNTQPIWPNIGYDFDARRKQLLDVLTQGCPEVQFLPTTIVDDPKHTERVLEGDREVDGYVLCLQGLGWGNDVSKLSGTGKPTLVVDNLFGGSGVLLTRLPQIMAKSQSVDWVSSSDDQDIVASARKFALLAEGKSAAEVAAALRQARRANTPAAADWNCQEDAVDLASLDSALKELKRTTILVVGGGWGGDEFVKAAAEVVGVTFVPIAFEEMAAAYASADRAAASEFADGWMARASAWSSRIAKRS